MKTWMLDTDREEAKSFKEEQKNRVLTDYIYNC